MSFIGIDLGTSFIKGAVLDLEGRRLQHICHAPFPDPLPGQHPLFCEYDPLAVVTATTDLIHGLSRNAPDCSGIVMCSQMHGLVLMDGIGRAMSPCFSWRDQRALMPHPSGAGTFFDVLTQCVNPEQLRQLGNELQPGTPIGFLFWLAEQGKLAPGMTPVSIPDFVLSVLCKSAPGVEPTNAAAYGLLNLETLDWHRDVIKQAGLDRLNWPPVRKWGEVVGSLRVGDKPIPCYTPVGDYQCALVGALLAPEELSLNISTGSQVSRLTSTLILGNYQSRPFFDGKFLNTLTHIPAGRSLNMLVDLLSELATAQGLDLVDPWTTIAREVEKIRQTDLEVRLTFFPGPLGDRGRVSNIRGNNLTVGHLFRAAFNSMAENYWSAALRLWPDHSWRTLVFSGGLASKLEALRRVIQKKLQTTYRLAPFGEDTLFGLLALALVVSGKVGSVERAMSELRSVADLHGA